MTNEKITVRLTVREIRYLPDTLVTGMPKTNLNSLIILQLASQYLASPFWKFCYVVAPPFCFVSCLIGDLKIMLIEFLYTGG